MPDFSGHEDLAQRRAARPGRRLPFSSNVLRSMMGRAQRRAARPGRRLHLGLHGLRVGPDPLNEGRPGRAADSGRARRRTVGGPPLNEGRPGRAADSLAAGRTHMRHLDAQRRAARPGRRLSSPSVLCARMVISAQRRAARPGRRLPARGGRRRASGCALNEGRPGRAADSRCQCRRWRGPGQRSTKGGPAGPPTRRRPVPGGRLTQSAQRRAARPGRRLPAAELPHPPADVRSTKGGPAGPPTLPGLVPPAGVVARSTKGGPAGPPTPADSVDCFLPLPVAQRRAARPGRRLRIEDHPLFKA